MYYIRSLLHKGKGKMSYFAKFGGEEGDCIEWNYEA